MIKISRISMFLMTIYLGTGSCILLKTHEFDEVQSPIKDNLHNGFFLDDTNGWILSYGTGKLLKTTDGGESWYLITQIDSLFYEDIVFISEDKGWICGEYGSLLYTINGGNNWSKKVLADSSIAFYGLDFITTNNGILVGYNVKTRRSVMYRTNDGGETWILRSPLLPIAGGLEHIWFSNRLVWYIGGRGLILKTSDAGVSWQAGFLNEDAIIRGLFFSNAIEGYAVGHDGMIFQTHNGGKSWQQLERFTNNRLRSIYFINRKMGYICGDNDQENGSLWYTYDGGRNWMQVPYSFPDLHRIIKSPHYLWIIGKSGFITKLKEKN